MTLTQQQRDEAEIRTLSTDRYALQTERDQFRAALAGLVDACDTWGLHLAHEPQTALETARKLLGLSPTDAA